MAAPSSFVDWDTNATHVSPVTSGHASDGYGENEIPASDELNQLLMLIGLWIRYLAGFTAAFWQWFTPWGPNSGVTFTHTSGGAQYCAGAGTISIPISLPVGSVINSVGVIALDSATSGMLVYLTRHNTSGDTYLPGVSGGGVSTLDVTSVAAAFTQYTGNLTTPETVVQGYSYTLDVILSSTQRLQSVGVNATPSV